MSEYYVELGPFINPVPEVTEEDNGMFLGVESGEWTKVAAPSSGGTKILRLYHETEGDLFLLVVENTTTALSYDAVNALAEQNNLSLKITESESTEFEFGEYGIYPLYSLYYAEITQRFVAVFGPNNFKCLTGNSSDPLILD